MPYSITITQPQHATLAVLDAAGDPVSELDAGSVAVVDAEADAGYVVQSLSVTAGGQAVEMDGSAFAMPESDVTVTATVVEEGGDVPPSPADKAALISAIEAATNDGEETHVSADGEDVYTTDWWALQADVDALYAVVAAALKVADDDAATQADADAQEAAVEAAHTAFLAARSHGSLVPPEQVPDPAGEPATDGDPSNLYRWTQRFDGTLDEWLLPDGTWEDAPSSAVGGFGVASLAVLPFQEVGLAAGESYTLSWDEKAKRAPTVLSDGTVGETSTGVSETADSDGFYRAWATFSMSSAGTWATVQLSSATQVRALKFEQGTAATDWTANPADVDTRDLDNTDPPDPDIVGPSDDTDVPSPDAAVPVDPDDLPIVPVPEIDPETEVVELSLEAMAAAAADNQHFWTRASAPTPDDGAGTGAFVTDEAQDTFLEAMAQDVQPTEARPLHNLLMNSLGILLRSAKRVLAQFTPSGVAFYDGEGNAASNVVAQFGKNGAQIGKSSANHITLNANGMSIVSPEGSYGNVNGVDAAENEIARFGSVARIGKENSAHAEITDDSLYIYDDSGSNIRFWNPGGFGSIGYSDAGSISSRTYMDISVSPEEGYDGPGALFNLSSNKGAFSGFAIHHDNSGTANFGGHTRPSGESVLYANYDNINLDIGGSVTFGGNLSFGSGAAATQYYFAAKTPGRNARVLFVGGGVKQDGDVNGTVVGLGAGGLTLVGGGEYATNRYNVGDLNDTDERLYLGADGGVYIESNGNAIADRKTWEFSARGHFYVPTSVDGASSPSATVDSGIILSSYKREDHSARVLTRQTTANRIAQLFEVGRYINGSWKWNSFSVGMDANGDRTYSVGDPAAFRSAIGLDPQKTGANADTAWVSNATASNFFVAKSGNSAVLRIGGVKLAQALPHGSNKTVGTLPDGYKAYCPVNGVLFNLSSGVVGMVSVSGGNIVFRNTTGATIAANTELYGSVAYLTA